MISAGTSKHIENATLRSLKLSERVAGEQYLFVVFRLKVRNYWDYSFVEYLYTLPGNNGICGDLCAVFSKHSSHFCNLFKLAEDARDARGM